MAGSGAAGSANGQGTGAVFNQPTGVAFDAGGNVVLADKDNHRIRRITPGGAVTTIAGSGTATFGTGTGTAASFHTPYGADVDAASGNIFVADQRNNRIRRVVPSGTVFATGSGTNTFADGVGVSASFSWPSGVGIDAGGNAIVADCGNGRIRKVTPGSAVTTLAGSGVMAFADGAGAAARFNCPIGIAIDGSGTIFVGDSGNHRIRKVSPVGAVSTLAGSGSASFADGVGGAASFNSPHGVAIDASGNVLVADKDNHRVRKVSPGGVVTTLGGSGGQTGVADGVGAAARFNRPLSFAPDGTGGFFLTDPFNHRISRATGLVGFPRLTTVPTNQTFGTQGTSLSVSATGNAPLAYQWQLNGTNLPNATDATFAIAGNATGAGRYTVTVTNVLGAATSAEASLLFFDGLRFYAGMSLTGVVGRQYRVDFADIVGGVTNWVALTNLTLTANPVMVIDPTSAGLTNRSYRAVLLP